MQPLTLPDYEEVHSLMEQMGNIFGYLNDFITLLNTIKIYF